MPATAPCVSAADAGADRLRRFGDCLQGPAAAWWRETRQQVAARPDAETVSLLSSLCRRRLGDDALPAGDSAPCTLAQQGRALLLATALAAAPAAERPALLRQVFRWGDDDEKIAILRALDWLDPDGLSVEIALQAGRTNNCRVFSAIALDNPYPARRYDERAFHQLVLKALSLELDIRRIRGLPGRRSANLNRLTLEMLHERLAADRPEPDGIAHAVAFDRLDHAQKRTVENWSRQGKLGADWSARLPSPTRATPR